MQGHAVSSWAEQVQSAAGLVQLQSAAGLVQVQSAAVLLQVLESYHRAVVALHTLLKLCGNLSCLIEELPGLLCGAVTAQLRPRLEHVGRGPGKHPAEVRARQPPAPLLTTHGAQMAADGHTLPYFTTDPQSKHCALCLRCGGASRQCTADIHPPLEHSPLLTGNLSQSSPATAVAYS